VNSFIASGHTKILGSGDSMWVAPADSISNKIFFHDIAELGFSIFTIIDEQENHTVIDIIENVLDFEYGYDSTYLYKTRYDFQHSTNSFTQIFYEYENVGSIFSPIWVDSLVYMNDIEWASHSRRVFTSSFNYGIDLGNSGISVTDFDGTLTKWEDVSFQSISGIDLDLDANVDVLALNSTGVLYAFNSDLILMAGFPSGIELQAPILARDLFNDEHPEIVAKSADSSSIYIFDHQGNVKYQITSNKDDALVALKPIDGKNSIITRSSIYQFGEETETNGNEWSFEHSDWGRSRKINLDYTFGSSSENQH
jgi:hypothetical protein